MREKPDFKKITEGGETGNPKLVVSVKTRRKANEETKKY